MSESIMPAYISHKQYGQTRTKRSDIISSPERERLLDEALHDQDPSYDIEQPVMEQQPSSHEGTPGHYELPPHDLAKAISQRVVQKRRTSDITTDVISR